jgi:hypothetical protein
MQISELACRTPWDHENRIRLISSARQETARATYKRALRDFKLRDDIVTSYALEAGDWIRVRHEKPLSESGPVAREDDNSREDRADGRVMLRIPRKRRLE